METYHWGQTWNYKQIYEFPQDNGRCISVACTCAPCPDVCSTYIRRHRSAPGTAWAACAAMHNIPEVQSIASMPSSSRNCWHARATWGLVVMVAVDTARLPVQTTYGTCGRSTTWAASIGCRSGGSSVWPPKTFPSGFILLPVICLTCTAVGGIDCHNGFWNGEVEIPEVWLMQHSCNTDRI